MQHSQASSQRKQQQRVIKLDQSVISIFLSSDPNVDRSDIPGSQTPTVLLLGRRRLLVLHGRVGLRRGRAVAGLLGRVAIRQHNYSVFGLWLIAIWGLGRDGGGRTKPQGEAAGMAVGRTWRCGVWTGSGLGKKGDEAGRFYLRAGRRIMKIISPATAMHE
ncbi:uncharacterized protein BDV17DRAFT_222231 [Aspergillus undulatus]|uniref:uncharacterized protein n=1 Tax=Aspergillus undulatus TaxID=1810928 RepID=UPI003CCCD4C5